MKKFLLLLCGILVMASCTSEADYQAEENAETRAAAGIMGPSTMTVGMEHEFSLSGSWDSDWRVTEYPVNGAPRSWMNPQFDYYTFDFNTFFVKPSAAGWHTVKVGPYSKRVYASDPVAVSARIVGPDYLTVGNSYEYTVEGGFYCDWEITEYPVSGTYRIWMHPQFDYYSLDYNYFYLQPKSPGHYTISNGPVQKRVYAY